MHEASEAARQRRQPESLPASERLRHTIREAAQILCVSQRTVWRLIADKKLGATKGGRTKRYIARAELEAFVAREQCPSRQSNASVRRQ